MLTLRTYHPCHALAAALARPLCLRAVVLCLLMAAVSTAAAQQQWPSEIPATEQQLREATEIEGEDFTAEPGHIVVTDETDIPVVAPFDKFSDFDQWEERDSVFTPDPTRAVWMSALCPGLGQVYNRRYWKLPILVGGYLGLAYATSWNNTMLTDYTRAYRDIMDTDPTTKSYMDFFPPTVKEEDLDKNWLTNVLQSRKNYFRRNRDLCIISMVGVYLLAMVDAYVDASLSHFDVTPDLSLDLAPTLIPDSRGALPSIGLQWAFSF